MWPFAKICIHNWAFAEGTSLGQLTGKPRVLCFRRACTKCNSMEYVMNYKYRYQCNGIDYMAEPQWVKDDPGWGK